jgi:hypothetical protein
MIDMGATEAEITYLAGGYHGQLARTRAFFFPQTKAAVHADDPRAKWRWIARRGHGAVTAPANGWRRVECGVNLLGIRPYNWLTGSNVPMLQPASQSAENLMTRAGALTPETSAERVIYDINRGGAGAASFPSGTANQMLQGVSGALSAGASGAAREAGAGPLTQLAVGLGTGIAVPSAWEGIKGAGRGVRALVQPFTPGGRERVVGSGLNRLATDPGAAMRNMGQAEEIVPGSVPTTAQASRDVGLLSTERALQGTDPASGGRLAQRFAEQNRARIGALDELAKDPAALELAKSQRRELIGPLYEKAFQDFKGAPQSPAIQEVMTKLKGSPAIAKAQQLARLEGLDLDDPSQSLKGLHYLKLAIDDMLDRSFESGLGRTEQRALISVRIS